MNAGGLILVGLGVLVVCQVLFGDAVGRLGLLS